ncbi:MAG: hypothetical protein FWC95_07630, partial [Defluviitaleaceae bacterium]|nr:hypothetical protein [Defluviitaleaceae bacterium]
MLKRKRINPTRARRMFNAVFISVAFLFSLMAVLTGNYVDVAFNLQPGQLSPRRIQSPRDTVNLPATLAKRAAAEAEVRAATAVNPPIIRDETVTAYALGVLQAFFEEVEVLRQRHNPIFDPVLGEMPEAVPIAYMDGADLRVPTPDEAQLAFLVASPSYVYVEFREYVLSIVTERLMAVGGIVEEHLPGVRDSVIAEINLLDNWAEEAKQVAHSLIIATLTANMVIDYENIETQIANAISAVESIIILRGQDIVLEGAFITDEIYEVLVSLGLVQGRLAELVGTVFGAIITVAAVFIIGIMYIVTAYRKLMMDRKNVVLLFTLFMLTILGAYMLPAVSFVFVPIILFTMLASILLDKSLAIAFCIWVSIICAGITIGDIRFVIYFMLTGIFSAIMSRMIIERSKMLSVTVLVSAFSFLAVLAVFLLSERAPSREMWDTAAFAAIVGLVSIVF